MRTLIIGGILSLAACDKPERQHEAAPSGVTVHDSTSLSQVQDLQPPTIASPDSTALIAPEDSVLDEAPNARVVLPNGDTIADLGGHLTWAGGSEGLGISHYTKNGTHYIRIQRILGHKPGGRPIEVLLARLRLPPMDSTESWTDLCRINGKSEPAIIIAVASTVGDSMSYNARKAWRFDRATETLSEIPSAGVTCFQYRGE